jgi:hypothetical protein
LGRPPKRGETPSIIGEFVSAGKRARERDYQEKRDEYMAIKVKEYWVFDRFERSMTVFIRRGNKVIKRVLRENEIYTTDLCPALNCRWPSCLLWPTVGRRAKKKPNDCSSPMRGCRHLALSLRASMFGSSA